LFGYAGEVLKLLSENRVAAFKSNDSLADARECELAAGDFNRQFLSGFGAFASDAGDLFGAGTFTPEQLE
jgi:hypothetical protein